MLQRPHRVSCLKVSSWVLMGSDETLFMGQREGRGWTAGEQTPRRHSRLPNTAQTATFKARTRKINRELQVWVKLLQWGPISASGPGNAFPSTRDCTLIK